MSAKTLKPVRAVAAALLALAAGKASAAPPPLPSFDGVNPIVSGILPFVGNFGGRGVVRTSGGSTGSTVFANVNGTTVDIQTNAQRMVIDWQSFNIGEGHRVNFLLPDRASIAVNRVRGVGSEFVSSINGDLWSNGNVWLLNPNGVFFGPQARVDVAGLLATPAYLRNLDDLIGFDGTFSQTPTIGFDMPGASFPTEVTTPGAIGVAQGAEILVRGGPAMFIVGSGVQGRTLTVGGTVTSRSSDLLRGVLTPPSASSQNGSYGSLPTTSDPAEEISSQVVYAASGDFALSLAERSIAEPSPPNPLSSKDLDLFELVIERGFAGRQGPQDQMASEVIFVDGTAKTVAGQVVVRAAAEGSVLNRRYDPRTDLGDNLGCDPTQPICTITANPVFDTYVYLPQSGDYELLCTKGPATDACGPPGSLSGEQTANGFRFSAYLGVESFSMADYGCAEDPDCSPGILIRSSLAALDPREQSLGYGFDMDRSLIVDAAPMRYRGNVTLSRDAAGRPFEVIVGAAPNPGSVLVDPSYAQPRNYDFGGDGGVQPLALEFVSAGDIDIRGRDVCVIVGPCLEPGRIYAPNDPFDTDRVHLRLQTGPGRSSLISARRLMLLGETYLSGATLSLEGDQHTAPESGGQTPSPLRQMVIRNGFVDPRAGKIEVGDGSGEARIVVGSFGVDPGKDITLGSIYGTATTYISAYSNDILRIADFFDGSTMTPGVVEGLSVYLAAGGGLSVGDIQLLGEIIFVPISNAEVTPSLRLVSASGELKFGRIRTATPRDDLMIFSGPSLDFDPALKLDPDSSFRYLQLTSSQGKVCIGATVAGVCNVTDLSLPSDGLGIGPSSVEIYGRDGVEAGDIDLVGYDTLLFAEIGSVRVGDIAARHLTARAGAQFGLFGAPTPWNGGVGPYTTTVGDLAVDGALLLQGRDGVTAGDLAAGGAFNRVAIGLYSKSGSITAGTALSTSTQPGADFAVNAQTETGALISMASAEAGRVRLSAPQGAIKVGTESGSTFVGGAVTARTGGISLSGREGVIAGALTAASQVDVGAARGSVAVGAVIGNGPAAVADSACDGLTVCIGAGFDGTDGSGRTVTTGAVTATVGSVLMAGRDGLTTGGAVLAAAGSVEIRSSAGTVDTTAGTVTAGSAAGAFDAKLSGISLDLGDVTAQRDIDLAAAGATGSLTTGVLTATRALKVSSVAGFGIAATKIGGTPQSVLLNSADGGVCLGAPVNGVCTGQSLTKDTDLTLQGKTGVQSGALAVRSALVDSAQGSLALGDVTVTDGKLALYGRTGVTAGRLTQSRSGTPPTAPNIDLLSAAGAITVGDVSGTGLMYGRAAEGFTTGTITGVKDIDLRAGKALATGPVTATGFVQFESLEGSLTTGAVSAGAAKAGSSTDPCSGKAVCLSAGEAATAGTQMIGTGALSAATGDISVRGRSGVTVGDATATAGSVTLRSTAGAISGGAVDAGKLVDAQALGAALSVGAVTARDGTVLLRGRDGVTAGRIVQTRTGGALQVPDVALAAEQGAVSVGEVSSTGSLRGDASTDLTTGALTAGADVRLLAGRTITTGDVVSAGGVGMQAGTGTLTAGDITAAAALQGVSSDPCNGQAVCLRAGEGASSGTQTLRTGDVVATTGAMLLRGRSGVTLDSARADRGSIAVDAIAGGVTSGALTAGDMQASAPLPYRVGIQARDAITIGTAASPAPVRATGEILMFSTAGSIDAGALSAGRYIDVDAAGSLRLGALNARGTQLISATDPCNGASVCVTAGGGPQTGLQTATVGPIVADAGAVFLAAPTVMLGGATASDGDLVIRSGSGAVTATGDLVAGGSGSTAADRDVIITSGASIAVRGVRASGDITLEANGVGGTSGTISTGALQARRALSLQSTAGLNVVADDIVGDPESVRLASGSGSVCLGTLVNGVCTGQALSKNSTGVELVGRTGVTTGDLGTKSLRMTVSEGAAVSGALTSAQGISLAARDGVKTGDVAAQKEVSLVASAGMVDAGLVAAADGTVLLQGRTGVKAGAITQARSGAPLQVPDVDLNADGGSITVGAVSGTGSLRGRALDDLAIGAVSGVDAVDLSAGKTLSASGAIAARGAVGLRSDTGTLAVQDVTAGAGDVLVRGRSGVTTGDVRADRGIIDIGAAAGGVALGALRATEATVTAGAGDVRLGGAVTLAPAAGTPAGSAPALRVQAARDITVAAAVTSERNVAFVAGRNFANTSAINVTGGTAADGSGAAGYGGIDIRAADAEIGAALRARGAGVNLLATGNGGIALGDGVTAAAGAMRLTNAELQSIDAPTVALRSATSATAGRDIVVGDLTLDRARIGELTLATRQGGKVRVTGTMRGTGAPALQIGESGMRPDAIEVSGALGASDAAIGTLQLRSAGNILLGPQSFIDAANAAQDIRSFDVDAASQGATAGRLFLVSGATSFDAPGAILQQNTGATSRDGDGIRIGAPAGVVTATFGNGTAPQRIALFGRVVDAQGNAAGGRGASLVTGLLPVGMAANPLWQINTCVIGTGAGCATTAVLPPPSVLVQPPLPPPPPPPPPGPDTTTSAVAGGSTSPGSSGEQSVAGGPAASSGSSGSSGSGGQDEDEEGTAEAGPEPQPVPTVADAAPTAEERRIYPLEVDPGSRDLLRPADDGVTREPGVGSANEDLWPTGVPLQ